MLEAIKENYDKMQQYPEYLGITSSLALGFLPALFWGKDSHKLGAAIAFHVGAGVIVKYLKEHDYISPLTKDLIEYTTSAPIFCASFNSYNDFITTSLPLKDMPVINYAYLFGAENAAKAFAFGAASLSNMIAASEISKEILRNVDDEALYPAAPSHIGVWTGLKYFAAMNVKYSLFPIVQSGESKIGYSGHYLGAGAVQGVMLSTLEQLVNPSTFDAYNFTRESFVSAYDNAINAFLYIVPGDAVFGTEFFKSLKEKTPVFAYVPISAVVEDVTLLLKNYGIPELSDLTMKGIEMALVQSSNSTMIDEL